MDIWQSDPDQHTAQAEGALSDLLSNFLYRVHQDAHRALGLPAMPVQEVKQAYQAADLPMSKADGINRAQRLFEELRQQPKRVREAEQMADALTQDWFERGLIRTEAQRVITQANLHGRIEAAGKVEPRLFLTEPPAALLFGQERAALHCVRLKDTTRAVLAGAVVDALTRGDSPTQLAQDLIQRFGTLNRDARRLAITEVAFARNNGFLASVPVGEDVEWFTAAGCCPACARMNGRKFRVVSGPGDPQTEVWVGKHGVGLPADQRIPTLPYHPNCRCRWVKVYKTPQGVSAQLDGVLDNLLSD